MMKEADLSRVPDNTIEETIAEGQDQAFSDVADALSNSYKLIDLLNDAESAEAGLDTAIAFAQDVWILGRKALNDELSEEASKLAKTITKQGEETYRTLLGSNDELPVLGELLTKFSELIGEEKQFMQRVHSREKDSFKECIENVDKLIGFWRNKIVSAKTSEEKLMAECYVDAFQTVRVNNGLSLLEKTPNDFSDPLVGGNAVGERVMAVYRRTGSKVAYPITPGLIEKVIIEEGSEEDVAAEPFVRKFVNAGKSWFDRLVENLTMAGEKTLADQIKQTLNLPEFEQIAGRVGEKTLTQYQQEMKTEREKDAKFYKTTILIIDPDNGNILDETIGSKMAFLPGEQYEDLRGGKEVEYRRHIYRWKNNKDNVIGSLKQARPTKYIKGLMERGKLSNPYELTQQDVGHYLGGGFDLVISSDVGRLVFLKDDIIQMENDEQMEKRKGV